LEHKPASWSYVDSEDIATRSARVDDLQLEFVTTGDNLEGLGLKCPRLARSHVVDEDGVGPNDILEDVSPLDDDVTMFARLVGCRRHL
jgi:hypothetical protein